MNLTADLVDGGPRKLSGTPRPRHHGQDRHTRSPSACAPKVRLHPREGLQVAGRPRRRAGADGYTSTVTPTSMAARRHRRPVDGRSLNAGDTVTSSGSLHTSTFDIESGHRLARPWSTDLLQAPVRAGLWCGRGDHDRPLLLSESHHR
jgi:hypothetical protein